MARALINVPAKAKRGEIIEIKTLISHNMETGFRPDSMGRPAEDFFLSGEEIIQEDSRPVDLIDEVFGAGIDFDLAPRLT